MIKKYGINLLIIIISTILALCIIEGVLRLVISKQPWEIGPRSSTCRLQTDEFCTQVTTNENGIREPHSIGPRLSNTFRIVIVGGSFVYGWGVNYEKTLGQIIQRELQPHTEKKVEVINVSRPGADITNYYTYVSQYALGFQPNFIIFCYVFGRDSILGLPLTWGTNPFLAYKNAKAHVMNARKPPLENQEFKFVEYGSILLKKDFWVRFLTSPKGYCSREWDHPNATFTREKIISTYGERSDELRRFEKLEAHGFIEKAQCCKIMPYRINEAIASPGYWQTILGEDPKMRPIIEKLWDLTHETLYEISEAANLRKIPIFFAGIPPAYLVDSSAILFAKKLNQPLNELLLNTTRVSDYFLKFCKEHQMSCSSYLKPLRQAAREHASSLYYPLDTHMTPYGTEVLGRLIAKDVCPLMKRSSAF